jgi:pilus assembly protein CpaD
MKHIGQLVSLFAASVLLTACTDRVITYATWKQFPPIVEPQATATPVRLDLHFGPGSDAISPDNEVALSNFLAQSYISNGGAVDLSVPLPQAGESRLLGGRISAVEKTLARRGIVVTSVLASQDGTPNSVSVLGSATTVHLPPCPGYTTATHLDSEQAGVSNFGCSNTINLDLMVANPPDLVQGRPLPPADAQGAIQGLQRYRDGKVIAPERIDSGTQ